MLEPGGHMQQGARPPQPPSSPFAVFQAHALSHLPSWNYLITSQGRWRFWDRAWAGQTWVCRTLCDNHSYLFLSGQENMSGSLHHHPAEPCQVLAVPMMCVDKPLYLSMLKACAQWSHSVCVHKPVCGMACRHRDCFSRGIVGINHGEAGE